MSTQISILIIRKDIIGRTYNGIENQFQPSERSWQIQESMRSLLLCFLHAVHAFALPLAGVLLLSQT